jgi:hypothetical protein
MACRLITKVPYNRGRDRPKLHGLRYAHNARQYRPRPRAWKPYWLLLSKSLCGMLHLLGRTDRVMGLSKLHATFSVIDTMRLRACMFALQPRPIRTLLWGIVHVQPSACLHFKCYPPRACPKASEIGAWPHIGDRQLWCRESHLQRLCSSRLNKWREQCMFNMSRFSDGRRHRMHGL